MPQEGRFSYRFYFEAALYVALSFFVIPIKLPKTIIIEDEFQNYMMKFNKSYSDEATYSHRLAAFKSSLETIEHLNTNRTNLSAQFGLTKFSDLTQQEFMSFQSNMPGPKLGLKKAATTQSNSIFKRDIYWDSVPKVVDWRDKNVVTSVKYQKDCGACWAFAVIETVESMKAIKTKQLVDLSVQQMIDCSLYNRGCQGGDICLLLGWLKNYNISIASEAEYPLTLKDQQCQKNDLKAETYISQFECNNLVGREDVILKLIAEVGPVAVGISGQTWQNYVGGVIQFHCDGDLSHAVQIVGYNLNAEVPYYIIRNSWGEDFGDNGYSYVAIGNNQCGLAYEVASLLV